MASSASISNTSDLIYYLINISPHGAHVKINSRSSINRFIYHVSRDYRYATRNILKKQSTGCKYWQLVIAMLIIVQKHSSDNIISILTSSNSSEPYRKLVETCQSIFSKKSSNRDFNELFYNKVSSHNHLLQEFHNSPLPHGVNYFCIYNSKLPITEHSERFISHFFTIVRISDTYWLTSSYGSDLVCVPAYTTPLNIDVFFAFVRAFYEGNWEFIKEFYLFYFFQGNIPKRLHNKLKEFHGEHLFKGMKGPYLEKGPNIEMKIAFENTENYQFRVGIIPEYERIIESIMLSKGGKKKRTIKHTRKRK